MQQTKNDRSEQLVLRGLAAEVQSLTTKVLADWLEALDAKHPEVAEYGSAAAVLALAALAGDFGRRVGLTAEMVAQACTQGYAMAALLAEDEDQPETGE